MAAAKPENTDCRVVSPVGVVCVLFSWLATTALASVFVLVASEWRALAALAATPITAAHGRTVLSLVALGWGIGLLLAPVAALIITIRQRSQAASSALAREAGVVPALLVASLAGWVATDPLTRRLQGLYVALVLAAALVTGLCVRLARGTPTRLEQGVLGALLLVSLAAGPLMGAGRYPELISLAHLTALASLVALLQPARRALARAPAAALLAGVMACSLAALAGLSHQDRLDPRHAGEMRLRSLSVRRLLQARLEGSVRPAPAGSTQAAALPFDPEVAPLERELNLSSHGHDHRGAQRHPDGSGRSPGLDLVVLVSLDALRADAISPTLTPALWRAAERGRRMTSCYAAGSSTAEFVQSLVLRPGESEAHSLPDLLRRGAVTSSKIISGRGGEVPDLEHRRLGYYFDHKQLAAGDAARTSRRALERITSVQRGKHFLWVHYMDLHDKYRDDLRCSAACPLARVHRTRLPRKYTHALGHLDHAVGQLLDGLGRRPGRGKTAVIITGDHGEMFEEHGFMGHGASGYDQVLSVPAVLIGPGIEPATTSRLASHADLQPTILDAFGIPAPQVDTPFPGLSWFGPRACAHDMVHAASSRYVSGRKGAFPLDIFITRGFKLVYGREDGLFELYDRRRDATEERNLALERPGIVRALMRRARLL